MWREQLLPVPGLRRLLCKETCACLIPEFPQTLTAASLPTSTKWAFALHCLHHVLVQVGTVAEGPPEPAVKSPFLPRKQGALVLYVGSVKAFFPITLLFSPDSSLSVSLSEPGGEAAKGNKSFGHSAGTNSFRASVVRCEVYRQIMKVLFAENCTVHERTMEVNNVQLQSSSRSRTSTYRSGDYIFFACKQWYRQVSRPQKFRAQCLDGVIKYPTCECECSVPGTRRGSVGGSFAEIARLLL